MADEIQITSRCLLRYYVGLSMEAARLDHCRPRLAQELNAISGKRFSARQWLAVLEPYYCARFCPEADSTGA